MREIHAPSEVLAFSIQHFPTTELPHRDPPRGMFPSAIFQRTGAGLSAIALAAAEALAAADLSRHPIRRRSREGGRAWHKPTLTHIDGNASVIIQKNF